MYKGKQPFYIIGTLTGFIVVIGLLLVFLTINDQNSALTGSTIMVPSHQPQKQQTEPLPPQQVPKGSMSVPFDPEGKQIIDFQLNQEIHTGPYIVKILGVKTADKVGEYITPDSFQGKNADKLYYIVQIQITNTGAKEGYVPEDMFTLSDGSNEYLTDIDGNKFFYKDGLFYPVLRTNVKRNGKIAFDVDSRSYYLLVQGDADIIYRMKVDA